MRLGSFLSKSARIVSRATELGGFALDRAIAPLSPRWAFRRMNYRRAMSALAAFEAARKDRTTHNWRDTRSSADQATLADAPVMNARARMAVRDDWQGQSILSAYRRNVVGGTGIWPRANARDANGEPRKAFNAQVNKWFRRWAMSPRWCDVEGTKSLQAILRLAVDEKHTVGNAFIVLGYEPRRDMVGLTLQMFEQEQLAVEKDGTTGGTGDQRMAAGNEIRGGIERDRKGRPVAYWVHLDRHPMEGAPIAGGIGSEPVRIEARRVLHYRRQTRVRETLSPTPLSPVLKPMWRRQSYDDNEQFAKELESFLGFAIKRNAEYGDVPIGFNPSGGGAAADGYGDAKDAGGNRKVQFEQGMMPVLYDREEIQMFNPQRPGSNYEAYMRRQDVQIAAGAELSRAAVAREVTGSYSAARQEMLDDWKVIDIEQDDMITQALRDIYRRFVELGVLEQRFTAPGFFADPETREDWLEHQYKLPKRHWVDPAKEAAAQKISIDYLLASRADTLGPDVYEVFDQIDDEREYLADLDITPPEVAIVTSPSEPKVHGTGDEEADSGESPRTQSAPGSRRNGHDRGLGRGDFRGDAISEMLMRLAMSDAD